MWKRPLCFLALVLAAVLLLLDKGGLPGRERPRDHPVIQDLIEKGEPVEVFGEADRWETETGQYLYLKHTILPYSGEQTPLHGVKVKIRERKKWKTGELVRVRGVLTLPEKGRNPGQFDSRAYLDPETFIFRWKKEMQRVQEGKRILWVLPCSWCGNIWSGDLTEQHGCGKPECCGLCCWERRKKREKKSAFCIRSAQ